MKQVDKVSDFKGFISFSLLICLLRIVLVFYCCYNILPQPWWLKQHKYSISQFCRPDVQHSSHWVRMKVLAGRHVFLGALRENLFPCIFCLPEAPHIPWLVTPFLCLCHQQWCIPLGLSSVVSSPCDWLQPGKVSLFKDSHDKLIYRAIQDNLPISMSSALVTFGKFFLPC